MTPQERDAIETLLAVERGRAAANEAGLVAELASIVEASDQANLDDEHDPEGATVGYERARLASLLDEARIHLARIEQVAARLGDGTYGVCDRCGNPIAFERLAAHPVAVTCVACQERKARSPLHRR